MAFSRPGMESTVGEIITNDYSCAVWEVNWSACLSHMLSRNDGIYSVSSPHFPTVIGTYWLAIQKSSLNQGGNFMLKLFTCFPTNEATRPIRLTVKGGLSCVSSGWLTDKIPQLEFDGFALTGSHDGILKISYTAREGNLNTSTRDASTSITAPVQNLKVSGKRTAGWISEEKATVSKGMGVPPNAGPSAAGGSQQKAPKSENVEVPPEHEGNASVEGTRKQKALKAKSAAKLIEDMRDLLLNERGSDVLLKVEGQELKAHKLILGMRSAVFLDMFEQGTEKKISVVTVDCNPEVFPNFMRYLYTGTVENLSSENAHLLYVAAATYQLQELVEECLEYMKNNVSAENFCDVMAISLQYKEEELKGIATQFFLANAKHIADTVRFATFMQENIPGGIELVVKLANYKDEQPVPNQA